jgi:hypothetical protein
MIKSVISIPVRSVDADLSFNQEYLNMLYRTALSKISVGGIVIKFS